MNNDLANLQTMLSEKEKEIANLSNELLKIQSDKSEVTQRLQEADNELFKLRVKCKDSDYLLSTKQQLIQELQSRLETPVAPVQEPEISVQNVKVSSLGAKKKPQQRKGKAGRSVAEAPQEAQTQSATQHAEEKAKVEALATSLNEEIALLKQKLDDSEAEKHTLKQRVQLLMLEIQSNEGNTITNYLNHCCSVFS